MTETKSTKVDFKLTISQQVFINFICAEQQSCSKHLKQHFLFSTFQKILNINGDMTYTKLKKINF